MLPPYTSELSFGSYSEKAREHAIYPDRGNNLYYPALGLCGEAGEVAEKIKKVYRDSKGEIDEETKLALMRELGDVMWYIDALCSELKISLEGVARMNLEKLSSRKERGKLTGSGDVR